MASFVDLASTDDALRQEACDVCVVGGGAAGLYLANRLSHHGVSVILIEAGGRTCVRGQSIGMDPRFSGEPYRGALDGRAFGWGGTTSRWGGLLAPHSELDADAPSAAHAETWAHVAEVVRRRSAPVYAALGLDRPPDFFTFPSTVHGASRVSFEARGLKTVAADFLPFAKRNLTYLVGSRQRRVRVFLNAVVSKWQVRAGDAGALTAVEAVSPRGGMVRVSAGAFVIAAGALESARMLLEIDRACGQRLLPPDAEVGRYLSDHLSCRIADVDEPDRRRVIDMYGPFFARGRMRSFRFIRIARPAGTPRHFAHFVFDGAHPGFVMAKELLSAVQQRRAPDVKWRAVPAAASGVARLAFGRFVSSRLFIPAHSPVSLHLDVEQSPARENAVSLGAETDGHGRPRAVVSWRVTDRDRQQVAALTSDLLQRWPAVPPAGILLRPARDLADGAVKLHDAYHPVGTCRMGSDGEATVDRDLRVRGTGNLFVLSTAVFPSAGSANPTFSMLCLGDRLAEQLAAHAFRHHGSEAARQ